MIKLKHEVSRKLKTLFLIFSLLLINMATLGAMEYYWEEPVTITHTDSRFPTTINNGEVSYVFWQEVDVKNKQIYISCRTHYSLSDYTETERFAGPFGYSGDEVPNLYTVALSKNGTVAVAVLGDVSEICVYTSLDHCLTFNESKLETFGKMIAPRIYTTHNGKFRIFTSVGQEDSFTVYTTESKDGISWSKFSLFDPVKEFRNPFIPVLCTTDKSDIVVFQAQYTAPETNRFSYQLFMTHRENLGWSDPVLLTDDKSLNSRDTLAFYKYQNQRPFLFNFNGKIYMSWERTSSVTSDIYVAEITTEGIKEFSTEQISSQGNASRGILFSFNNELYCNWFDTRSGKESIYMAKKTGSYWEESTLVDNRNANLFSNPLILNNNEDKVLTFVWQQKTSNNKNTIGMLYPDKSVALPTLKPITFRTGKPSKEENVQVQIEFPEDSSDIAGYSYTWSKDNPETPEKQIEYFTKNNKLKIQAPEDGKYYLSVCVADYAGNWSEPAELMYHRDLTPPAPPSISLENLDSYGFIDSNNFNLHWDKSISEDTEGYVYRIDYLGAIPKTIAVSSRHPMSIPEDEVEEIKNKLLEKHKDEIEKNRKMGTKVQTTGETTQRYYNKPNGVYLLSVAALDQVENISETVSEIFILNKFEPSTYITSAEQEILDTGDHVLTIYGGGFTYDGTISKIYIDKDGKAPYDFTLEKRKGDYKVSSDKKLSDVNLGPDIDEGTYKIGLYHTDRGLYFAGNVLKIAQNGTVKIESDYVVPPKVTTNFEYFKYTVASNSIIILLLIIFVILVIIFMFMWTKNTTYENILTKLEVKSLIKGDKMPLEKEKKKKHLPSLKGKLIRFTFVLIIIVVTIVTVQNGNKSIQLQARTMASGLLNRTEVLMESLNSGVKNFFPGKNLLELSALPKQKDAMEEVKYVTIIGQERDSTSTDNLNYIWATNDKEIDLKFENLDNPENYELSYGKSEITDEVITNITSGFGKLDEEIGEKEKDLSEKIEELSKHAEKLYGTGSTEDEEEANRLSGIIVDLRNKLDQNLAEYSKNAFGSYPEFNPDDLDFDNTDYIFYRPVMYRKGTSNNYIHSVIYLELSTKALIDSVNAEMTRILILGLIIAIIALVLGIFGSYVFASLIVRPIKKLEAHVTMVGQTKNKINLKGKDVEIKSKDEVGRLGDAINAMTRELVLNAEEEELAMDGKAVQKAFLPLADTGLNTKNTIAEYEDNNLQIYGYYEGESGVSGDYFDYRKLDNEWFGIIKCDASGHGIPAAIIMTVVATIFRRYFQNWSFKKNGTKLNVLVEQINDFIEGLGLKGKFATLIICLLNVRTGELYMCNAGDNLVHIYDGATKKMKLLTLVSVPTAGVFTSDLVNMRGGFKVEKTILNKGDTLFLYTDGIEESTRRIRELDYSVRQNQVEFKKFNPKTKEEETQIKLEDAKEEFGPERVEQIIESVYNKRKYILTKEDNPNTSEVLEFNFEKCQGTVKETVLALASLEKVYRLYKPDNVQQTDYIKIDKKIDQFLAKYFNMYDYYAANKSDVAPNSNYVDYDQMVEDEQSDDLTLLAIKRI